MLAALLFEYKTLVTEILYWNDLLAFILSLLIYEHEKYSYEIFHIYIHLAHYFDFTSVTLLQSVVRKLRPTDAPLIADEIMSGLILIMQRCEGKENSGVMEDALIAVSAEIEG